LVHEQSSIATQLTHVGHTSSFLAPSTVCTLVSCPRPSLRSVGRLQFPVASVRCFVPFFRRAFPITLARP
jgi:hypothetical protein